MKIPGLIKSVVIIWAAWYGIVYLFTDLLGAPIPASVMKMYMFFIIIGVFMAFTADEETAEEIFGPFRRLLFDRSHRVLRSIVFIVIPPLVFMVTYEITRPTLDAPVELRAVHPAPPSSFMAFGKSFNMLTLENPYRSLERGKPDKFREAVNEGRTVYYTNCFFCHGDKLEGKGHFVKGFNNPAPANFREVGAIGQLQESFLFWRIAVGGPGLPNEGAPWASPMPVWKDFLTEDQIWKVILFLYDYTGHRPRTFGK